MHKLRFYIDGPVVIQVSIAPVSIVALITLFIFWKLFNELKNSVWSNWNAWLRNIDEVYKISLSEIFSTLRIEELMT